MPHPPANILDSFATKGRPGPVEPYGSGHIHDTYRVRNGDRGQPEYVLQRVNHQVFLPLGCNLVID